MITNYVYEIVGLGVGEINSISPNNLLLIYSKSNASGASEFTELLDAPSSYTGQAGKVVKVNSTEDGLEFTDPSAGAVGDLQAVTDNGSTTTNPIFISGLDDVSTVISSDTVSIEDAISGDSTGITKTGLVVSSSSSGYQFLSDKTLFSKNSFFVEQVFQTPTANRELIIPDENGTLATREWALQRDGSNANSDVDLGSFNLNAKGVKINGTAGDGHLGLKHQSTNPTAGGQETVIFAGSDGEPRYKNDGGAIEQFASRAWVLTQGFITNVITALGYTPANRAGDTFTGNITATNLSGTNTGDETTSTIQTKRPLKTVASQSLEGVGNISLSKSDVGLGNVDNTSDLNKPISTATQTALNGKVNLNSIQDISLTSTIVGWSSFTTRYIGVLDLGNAFLCIIDLRGVSNNSTTSITVPFTNTGGTAQEQMRVENSGTFQNTPGLASIVNNSNVINFFLNNTAASFTNSGNKSVVGQILIYKTT